MIELLSEKKFNDLIMHGVTLVDFNTPWCAPCRAQEPILSAIAKQFADKASVIAMNLDNCPEIARALGIRSIPTLVIFKNGKEIQRFVGLQSEAVLSDALKSVLA